MQRVDLIVDGAVRNVRQRSDLPAFQRRVLSAINVARRVEIVRSHPITPPPPNPAPLDALARDVIFFAEVTEEARIAFMQTPPHVRGAVTADPSYHSGELLRLIDDCKNAGRSLSPWCDCRGPDTEPAGTPFEAAKAMQQTYGLDEPIGQAEIPMEYDRAMAAGARIVVGNPSGLTQDQIDDAISRHQRERLAFIGELEWANPLYSARGIPIASAMFYVWLGDGVYRPVESFLSACPASLTSHFCAYHAAHFGSDDWHAFH